ncbi:MAG: heat-inducible transcription repressor HrcA [Bacilli bacterium]|nr:heat-inducible transcription repressor HrcA [Bacilli bacterium]
MHELNRKEKLLKLIVEQFIKTAEPVGSSALIEEYDLPYSSATVRNEMAELEKLGYLEKTHTSSGRVPSSEGYRYYVDYLRDAHVDTTMRYQIQNLFESKKGLEIDEVIEKGCEIISQMTHLTTVVLGPDANQERINKVQLVPLNDITAVAVFVTDRGHVEHKTFSIPKDVSIGELESCVNIINDRICGTPINKVADKVDSLRPILAERIKNHEIVFKAFLEAFLKFTTERVSVFGRANMFEQPEFTNNIEKIRKLINLLENDSAWKALETKEGINVRIGSENMLTEMDDVSIVTANISVSDNQHGTIALVGPKRMDYNKALSALEYLQEEINRFFIEAIEEEEE